MINVQLADYGGRIFLEERELSFRRQSAGQAMFFDYRKNWRADLQTAFDCLNFHVDRRAFGSALMEGRYHEVVDLECEPGEPIDDQQLHGLALAMVPALERPEQVSRLFLEHLGWALCCHLAARYGFMEHSPDVARGGLAAWQERRSKELIEASLNSDISVEHLAAACGLSRAHFSRSFRISTGMPPHRWLISRRIAKAKDLLAGKDLSIAEIALSCGFSDQSHLSRVFRKAEGVSPMTWRRARAL
ncbi:AraC family transcriptional regulator [Sphingomonas trueperi]|uniref:helix-turn-helix domain-containing protein n=1 Tax=Sphingomonas trueperi TaxID=53317 RepID=UPI0033925C62